MYIMSNNNLQISYTKNEQKKNIIIITLVLIQNQSETIPETINIIIIIIQNQSKVKTHQRTHEGW